MAGLDDNVGVVGDWMPLNPTQRAYFSAVSGNNSNGSDNVPFSSVQRPNLGERIAVRAGFNTPPRLNTAHLSLPSDNQSPYLTIPPGLSPTTLLDSPVFLSNSLAQPSPTTGKFPFVPNGSNNKSSTSMMFEAGDRSRDKSFEDINNSSFAFKPVTNSGSMFFLGEETKVVSQRSFPSIEVSVQSANSPQEPESANGVGSNADHSPPLDEQQQDDEGGSGVAAISEDGYNWRKYGQKQVKGSEFPRSYYKCTFPNCQVKKKVERSHEGHITEIIYKGAHNHPKPPNRRSGFETRTDTPEPVGFQNGSDPLDWSHHDNSHSTSFQAQNGNPFESSDTVDASSTFSNEENEDDQETHGSVSLGYAGEEDESESKRRKIEAYATEMSGATRAIREPRVVVQTTSEVDILDDGYRWRKYGQKVVKGNPNPRSYYKCTSAGCAVRKHVERASHDLKSVITTYEGKHNHDVPAARNTSHHHHGGSVGPASSTAAATGPPQLPYVTMPRLDRPTSMGSSYGMSQPGLRADLGMVGIGGASGVPYLSRAAKSEPDVAAMANASASWSAVYQQMIGRLPLGPHM